MIYTVVTICIAVVLNILATRKLLRSERLLNQTKRVHIVLVWIIPILWAILILLFSDDPPKKNKKFERHRYMKSGYQSYVPRH